MSVDPRMAGAPHPALPGRWVYETPSSVTRLANVAIHYTIDDDDRTVTLWHFHDLKPSR